MDAETKSEVARIFNAVYELMKNEPADIRKAVLSLMGELVETIASPVSK